MNGNGSPVMISFPNLNLGKDSFLPEGTDAQKGAEVIYKIPPPVWMILLLIGGYLGIRWVMDD